MSRYSWITPQTSRRCGTSACTTHLSACTCRSKTVRPTCRLELGRPRNGFPGTASFHSPVRDALSRILESPKTFGLSIWQPISSEPIHESTAQTAFACQHSRRLQRRHSQQARTQHRRKSRAGLPHDQAVCERPCAHRHCPYTPDCTQYAHSQQISAWRQARLAFGPHRHPSERPSQDGLSCVGARQPSSGCVSSDPPGSSRTHPQ